MAYDICKKCQRFFEKSGKLYCEKCDSELKYSRENINNYLECNPNASIIEIVKEIGVTLKDVNIFIEFGGVASVDTQTNNTINLREEEMKKEQEIVDKREKLKMKNKFSTRKLRN